MSEAAIKPITSSFALLDVKRGRKALDKALGRHCADTPMGAPIPVTITGYIIGAWGDDDGTSQEFEIKVTGVTLA